MSFFQTRVDTTRAKLQTAGRALAADAALVITDTDSSILLNSTTGTKVATFDWTQITTTRGGTKFDVTMIVRSGGSYTIAATYGGVAGTVTFDAQHERAYFQRIGSTLYCLQLVGATFA